MRCVARGQHTSIWGRKYFQVTCVYLKVQSGESFWRPASKGMRLDKVGEVIGVISQEVARGGHCVPGGGDVDFRHRIRVARHVLGEESAERENGAGRNGWRGGGAVAGGGGGVRGQLLRG